ncbi:MAG: pentapeptide repeat-containing protein [Xenococcaceae cyanobacterium]
MTIKPDSSPVPNNPENFQSQNGKEKAAPQKSSSAATPRQGEESSFTIPHHLKIFQSQRIYSKEAGSSHSWMILIALAVMVVGLRFDIFWMGLSGALASLLLSLWVILPIVKAWSAKYLTPQERRTLVGFIGFLLAIIGLFQYLGVYHNVSKWLNQFKYDEFGSWAEWVGALGQILIAILAVYVAWQQYVISKDLTIQQNRITQQQTIDAYFQGISDLTLSEEGLLEDWPQERAIAEGRTAAILSSVDESGKAKILRFLSSSRLITPLMRDRHLGRPILDGTGGYAEDRAHGVPVIHLGVMLAGTNLSSMDLRWTDLSEANMVRADLSHCDLVKANFSRTILYEANLAGADLKGTRLFYGSVETASPRSRTIPPDYSTGAHTGVVIEKANLTGVHGLSKEQRYYCCCWGGEQTRATIPGGCEGIPNKLGR